MGIPTCPAECHSHWTNMLGGMTQRSAGMTVAKAVTLDMYHCARITS